MLYNMLNGVQNVYNFLEFCLQNKCRDLPSVSVPLGSVKDRIPVWLLFMQPQWGVTAMCPTSAFAAVDIQELLVRLVSVTF